MHHFPVFMDLRDQDVLLVGAGSVAERKARLLLQAGARLRVVARDLNPRFEHWLDGGVVTHFAREYDPIALDGVRLAFAATGDEELNQRVFETAEARGIPVNVVDDAARSRFLSPAVVNRSPLQIAISTGGASPVLARRLRAWIETLLPLGIGRLVEAAGRMRRLVKLRVPRAQRRGFWERVLSDGQIRRWSLLQAAEIERQLRQAIDGFKPDSAAGDTGGGRVYLVGAGPGRADLLTLRALQVLAQADVILHDRLVSDEVLDMARRDAERIDVGKRSGNHGRVQSAIHERMVAEARKGRTVVRLKGGDAFVFGRGGEELQYLHEHGVPFEVVPGITAAIGCAAYAGIPLTHRNHAHALTFITGHDAAGTGTAGRWKGIAGDGRTVIVYMGVRQAARIRRELLEEGLPANLPVAVVIDGTLERQRVLHGTVDDLPALAAECGEGSAGLLIVGQVAALGVTLAWFFGRPALRDAA